ncbi:hypothetical protein [Streptomyces vilmorinianum]|uniref:hypothetical protein n=1 Tax=Streptomyces vilmorinianum TaxID=3051092 RepID=UPI0010FBAA23|nr:hypothetical protein [Streptomyces vilmorinianum]
MRLITAAPLSAALLVGLVGCAGVEGRARSAEAAALAFVAELHAPDPSRACDALAPSTREELEEQEPCATALAELRIEPPSPTVPVRTDVFGSQARVVLGAGHLYLASFPDGWKITAAGCTPRPGRPDRCAVKGD